MQYETESRGHIWRRNSQGEVDIFAFESGMHNGPLCDICGYAFCHHCHEVPEMDCLGKIHNWIEEIKRIPMYEK
jgi:hypothetical protein